MAIAISYARFSSPAQATGDSLRRQTEAAEKYATANGLTLDLDLSIRDLGLSAFDGTNQTKGALGAFLQAVEEGRVPAGSTLIVESLDRLSRQQIMDALALFTNILNAGLNIVTLIDGQRYSRESVQNNFAQLLTSLVIMQRAHEESATKSHRITSSWNNKKALAKSNRLPLTRKTPHWIHADENRKFSLIPERVAVINRILDLAESGVGNHTIIKTLNGEGVPAWSASKQWQPSYVQKILHSPALYGAIDIDGDLVDEYYPAVTTRARFEYIKTLRSDRATTKNTNRKGKSVTNLFSGRLKCGYCGHSMNVAGYKDIKRSAQPYERKYVACQGARVGATDCRMRMWFMDELEPALLFWLTNVDYAAIMKIGSDADLQRERQELAALQARLEQAKVKVENTMVAIEDGASSMVPRLHKHEADVMELTKLVKQQTSTVAALTTREGQGATRMKGLVAMFRALKNTTDETQLRILREQLSAGIASAVEKIVLFPGGRSKDGPKEERFIDVYFKSGAERRIEPHEC